MLICEALGSRLVFRAGRGAQNFMNVFLGFAPEIQARLDWKPRHAHPGVTGPTARAPVGDGESTPSVAVYALVLHLRILVIFATIIFSGEKNRLLNEPNLFFHSYEVYLVAGCCVLTTCSCLEAALGSLARTVSFRCH